MDRIHVNYNLTFKLGLKPNLSLNFQTAWISFASRWYRWFKRFTMFHLLVTRSSHNKYNNNWKNHLRIDRIDLLIARSCNQVQYLHGKTSSWETLGLSISTFGYIARTYMDKGKVVPILGKSKLENPWNGRAGYCFSIKQKRIGFHSTIDRWRLFLIKCILCSYIFLVMRYIVSTQKFWVYISSNSIQVYIYIYIEHVCRETRFEKIGPSKGNRKEERN